MCDGKGAPDGRRLARQAFELLVRHAIALIPVYGPIASLGVELLGLVRDELSGNRPMTREDVLSLLRELSATELDTIVDAELSSPVGEKATASLSTAEVIKVRQALIGLPSQMASLMAQVEAEEQAETRQRKIAEARAREEKKQRDISSSREELSRAMQQRDWYHVNIAAQRLIRLGVRDRELRRMERFSYRRLGSTGAGKLALSAQVVALGIAAYIPVVLLGIEGQYLATASCFGVSMVSILGSTQSRVPMRIRTFIGVTGAFAMFGFWIYAAKAREAPAGEEI